MPFISYAQNFEDVMVWRALKDIEEGFYIDIGACAPNVDSVTKAFYDKGWHGLNIEPNPALLEAIAAERQRDINLQLAVSDHSGVMEMNFLSSYGLSTLDTKIAEMHVESGCELEKRDVEVATVARIWEQYVPEGQEVHFLKIDVEGVEGDVLRGNDWSRFRPWLLVIEATVPMSQVEIHEDWEPYLLEQNYIFAYADGLNRFYVSQEHEDLLEKFKYPPNVFDDFKLISQQEAELSALVAARESKAMELSALVAARESKAMGRQVIELQAQLTELLGSRSWKMTKPLRWARGFALWSVRGGRAWLTCAPGSRPRRVLRSALVSMANIVRSHPVLKEWVLKALNKFPRLKQRLHKVLFSQQVAKISWRSMQSGVQEGGRWLSPRVLEIYADLKSATEEVRKKEVD